MEDAKLKWASCCKINLECRECEKCVECERWYRYIKDHGDAKGYAHFDKRTSLKDYRTRRNVLNPKWVAEHAFWPLIQFDKSKDKFVGKKNGKPAHRIKKNPRTIRYCSHIDRCIYQKYSFLLDQQYNRVAAEKGIDSSAIAYRTNQSLNNLHHAKRAIDFIERTEQCLILVSDFASYFDQINHALLKKAVCSLMGEDSLPADLYAVFKSITMYSSWPWTSLMSFWKKGNPRITRKEINSKELVLPRKVFRSLVGDEAKRNDSGKGIPQGSPISAVLSNIYLIDFDESVHAQVAKQSGLYMRYCDDLLIVLPVDGNGQNLGLVNELLSEIKSYPGITIQEEKTSLLKYEKNEHGAGSIVSINRETGAIESKTVLDYLGVMFDGVNRKLRPKAISKYHYRMRRKAKTIAQQKKGRTNIYGVYSERAKQISGKRSFVDYAKSANRILGLNDPEADSIVKHNMEKIAKAINQASIKEEPN